MLSIRRVSKPQNFVAQPNKNIRAARHERSRNRSGYGDKNSMVRAKRRVNRKAHVHSMFD